MDCTSKPRSELGLLRLEKDRNEQISSEWDGHFCFLFLISQMQPTLCVMFLRLCSNAMKISSTIVFSQTINN